MALASRRSIISSSCIDRADSRRCLNFQFWGIYRPGSDLYAPAAEASVRLGR